MRPFPRSFARSYCVHPMFVSCQTDSHSPYHGQGTASSKAATPARAFPICRYARPWAQGRGLRGGSERGCAPWNERRERDDENRHAEEKPWTGTDRKLGLRVCFPPLQPRPDGTPSLKTASQSVTRQRRSSSRARQLLLLARWPHAHATRSSSLWHVGEHTQMP
jgi:hypothetical protein